MWLDALVTNVDRTPRNPNLLRWHGNLWLIDHGAALYAFHGPDPLARARGRVPGDPRPRAAARGRLDRGGRRAAGGAGRPGRGGRARARESGRTATSYAEFLTRRLEAPRDFAEEAERVRA